MQKKTIEFGDLDFIMGEGDPVGSEVAYYLESISWRDDWIVDIYVLGCAERTGKILVTLA